MSRVGKMAITVPSGVEVSVDAQRIAVKGVLGTLARAAGIGGEVLCYVA